MKSHMEERRNRHCFWSFIFWIFLKYKIPTLLFSTIFYYYYYYLQQPPIPIVTWQGIKKKTQIPKLNNKKRNTSQLQPFNPPLHRQTNDAPP